MPNPNKVLAKLRQKQVSKSKGYWVEDYSGNRLDAYGRENQLVNQGEKAKVTRFRVGKRGTVQHVYRTWKWVLD